MKKQVQKMKIELKQNKINQALRKKFPTTKTVLKCTNKVTNPL